eukprot:316833_1
MIIMYLRDCKICDLRRMLRKKVKRKLNQPVRVSLYYNDTELHGNSKCTAYQYNIQHRDVIMWTFTRCDEKGAVIDDDDIQNLYYGSNLVYFKACAGKAFILNDTIHRFASNWELIPYISCYHPCHV